MGARHSAELHKGSSGRGEQKLISSSLSLMKWNISSPMTRGGLITAINTESMKAKDGDLHRGRGWGETSKSTKTGRYTEEILKT